MLLVLLIAIAFALITVDIRGGEDSPSTVPDRPRRTVFGPIENGVSGAVDPIGNAVSAVRESGDRHDRLAELERRTPRSRPNSAATTATAAALKQLDELLKISGRASTASRAPRSSP
ncbi:hypothetical protein GCM10023238_28840 [Streptomyces heliomycini]